MLTYLPILTGLLFSSIYPLSLWVNYYDPIRNNYHKFHIGLANFVAGVIVVVLLFMPIPRSLKIILIIWKIIFLTVSRLNWKKANPSAPVMTGSALFGLFVYSLVHAYFLPANPEIILTSILGGFVLCSSIFTMNLGHFYLNVHGLPVKHLLRAVYVFWFFLFVRAGVDAFLLLTRKITYLGEPILLIQFLMRMDGFLLWIALFFGTLFPLMTIYFVRGTLLVKSTQSATGILYAILISILIGDFTYKYYLYQYAIAL